MLLRNFLHGDPVVWLDHKTGSWRPATAAEVPEGVPLIDVPGIDGDYLEEDDGSRFYRYWIDARTKFFFRSSDGTVSEIDGKKYAEVTPSRDLAGRPSPQLADFKIYSEQGQLLFIHTYNAAKYHEIYMSDFSVPASELEEWDFFLALKAGFEYMKKKRGGEDQSNSIMRPGGTAAGELCPREGYWFTPAWENSRRHFAQGELMPEVKSDHGATIWQWDSTQG
ncbi:hypothetical protein OOT46_02465 [Aquabacterium sp. A7-Y]|uniref:hypothetical protein n=1 Tax=Aquabacterium sp. A7-Y TaxID=1349605 RepID=UPI00223E028D|nr:hypothetical protein [Aquabacterium sp. A7-Y]MCW7536717.1 hypothetical protein [Aquabacterium sp. A7-Y]